VSDKPVNSAEREAEEILKGAYSEVRAEECPQGAECSVHFRVDEQYIDEPSKYVRLITYVDDYAVLTEDNPELSSPLLLVRVLLGTTLKEDLPPAWETSIMHVGPEGALGDLSEENGYKAVRYATPHGEWDEILLVHDATVSMLKAGLIDVSKSIYPEA